MCEYQALYHDDKTGYIVRCPECQQLQVGYGNLLMTFSRKDFSSFRKWIGRIKEEQSDMENKTLRCIVIPSPCEGIKLVLSFIELSSLDQMLETAENELLSLAMIDLFAGGTP